MSLRVSLRQSTVVLYVIELRNTIYSARGHEKKINAGELKKKRFVKFKDLLTFVGENSIKEKVYISQN